MSIDQSEMNYDPEALRALLHWYQDMGIDVATASDSCDFFKRFRDDQGRNPEAALSGQNSLATTAISAIGRDFNQSSSQNMLSSGAKGKPRPTTGVIRPDAGSVSPDEAMTLAASLAKSSPDISALEGALRGFDGCSLKKGARHTVFADGTFGSPLLVMGEAPGRDEDREGRPFVGRAGMLLDKMLAAIGQDRLKNTYISNVIFWRPPGNRTPSEEEMMICRPFAQRLIELTSPKIILIAGAVPLKALLDQKGIMKTRGKWQTFSTKGGKTIPVMPTFHPAYLLRNPQAKRLVWQDLQLVRDKLIEN